MTEVDCGKNSLHVCTHDQSYIICPHSQLIHYIYLSVRMFIFGHVSISSFLCFTGQCVQSFVHVVGQVHTPARHVQYVYVHGLAAPRLQKQVW